MLSSAFFAWLVTLVLSNFSSCDKLFPRVCSSWMCCQSLICLFMASTTSFSVVRVNHNNTVINLLLVAGWLSFPLWPEFFECSNNVSFRLSQHRALWLVRNNEWNNVKLYSICKQYGIAMKIVAFTLGSCGQETGNDLPKSSAVLEEVGPRSPASRPVMVKMMFHAISCTPRSSPHS